ncbi:hypothetical protein B0T24DRAFT_534167 [Lasiosphaeria ovina]|uniref:Uncharacterized protein n=1 Tax=Lasiosphaeria ovina TaxID=92902 RepID=A0AAE0JZT9_9PEZI|nr:hypothetical protein B0T24DRAFT_534167 [Lasiosphaeria ovina]
MDAAQAFIETGFWFLKRNDERYKKQRPYTFKFPPNNGCPMCNLEHEKVDGIRVEDMRRREQEFQLKRVPDCIDEFRFESATPLYPISDGSSYGYDQPTTVCLNANSFWKPLGGPTNNWPLVLCDSSLIGRRKDLAIANLLYPNLATENSIMYYRDSLRFCFLSEHQPNEIIVLKQMDSLETAFPDNFTVCVPHVSGYSLLAPESEQPRESIDGRVMVFYD